MKIKACMIALTKDDLDAFTTWIKASLCDGEDEKNEELALALDGGNNTMTDDEKSKCLKIRASTENVIHALLRVREMSSRLPEIFSPGIAEDDSGPDLVQNGGETDEGAVALHARGSFETEVNPNEDPELALALHLSMEEERARREAGLIGAAGGDSPINASDAADANSNRQSPETQIVLNDSVPDGNNI